MLRPADMGFKALMAAAKLSYKTKPVIHLQPVASKLFHPVPPPEEVAVPGAAGEPSSACPP